MSKPLKNGHDAPKGYSQSPGAIRSRRHRERKAKGAIVLKSLLIEPDLISALVQLGWINPVERGSRDAVETALNAVILHTLSYGVTPQKPLLAVDMRAVEAAIPWLKPGEAITPESAGRAVGIVSKCAAQVNFGPAEYASRARQMAGIN
jgi:hypothetical protein